MPIKVHRLIHLIFNLFLTCLLFYNSEEIKQIERLYGIKQEVDSKDIRVQISGKGISTDGKPEKMSDPEYLKWLYQTNQRKYESLDQHPMLQNLKTRTPMRTRISEDVELIQHEKNLRSIHNLKLYTKKLIKASNNQKLIYNRIPKCGSESFSFLILKYFKLRSKHRNQEKYGNNTWRCNVVWEAGVNHAIELKNPEYLSQFKQNFTANDKPMVYIRHMPFINFEDENDSNQEILQPMWFNIMRDPVDRFISAWYFDRHGPDRLRKKGKYLPVNLNYPMDLRNMSIEEAFLQDRMPNYELKNSGPYNIQLNYLCGLHPICLNNTYSKSILRQKRDIAINNINKSYILVGILEKFSQTVELLENILPNVFSNKQQTLVHTYQTYSSFIRNEFKTFNKNSSIDESIITYYKHYFTYEYDLYNYVKSRFTRQYQEMVGHKYY